MEALPRWSVETLDDGEQERVQLQVFLPGERPFCSRRRCCLLIAALAFSFLPVVEYALRDFARRNLTAFNTN